MTKRTFDYIKLILECIAIMAIPYLSFTHVILYGIVPSSSMSPTLNKWDSVIVNGLAYVKNESQRGDIIVFKGHEDSIQFIDGNIYINGQFISEKYISADVETNCFMDFEDIPERCYFVMGDNREDSWDSRFWENPYVAKDEIYGKMIICVPTSNLLNFLKLLF